MEHGARTRMISFLLVAVLAMGVAGEARSDTVKVGDEAQFAAALNRVSGGDVIQLADGTYPALDVKGHSYSSPVRIEGTRNAVLSGITFAKSSNLKLSGVTVAPQAGDIGPAEVRIMSGSHDIDVDNVSLNGRKQTSGVRFRTGSDTYNVTLQNSEVTTCGHDNKCIYPDASNLQILNNKFLSCEQCVWLKGAGGNGITIRGNSFGKVFPEPTCTNRTCIHLNHILIMGGGPWTIERNTFDDCGPGDCTAQFYVGVIGPNLIHDVLVQNNIFFGSTNWSIRIEAAGRPGEVTPKNIRIVNNTVVSKPKSSSIIVTDAWKGVQTADLPLVANNIFAFLKDNQVCGRGRLVANLVIAGSACTAGDRVGPANLTATNAPSPASSLVINAGDPAYAPPTDFFGRARIGRPDVGAIEFGGVRPLKLSTPRVVSTRLRVLRAQHWRVRLRIAVDGPATITVRLTRGHRTAIVARRGATSAARLTLSIALPSWARRVGSATIVVRATAPDAQPATQRVALRIRR